MSDAPNSMVWTSPPWSISGNHQQGLSLAPLVSPIQPSVEQLPPGSDVVPHQRGMHHHQGSPHFAAAYQFTQPMVREVSLYKGLPNSWQYRHDDFLSAHTEFMENKWQWDSNHLADTMTDDLQGFRGDMSFPKMHLASPISQASGVTSRLTGRWSKRRLMKSRRCCHLGIIGFIIRSLHL
jgi:hypothetical protein